MTCRTANFQSSLQKKLETISSERIIHYDLNRFRSALQSVGNPEKSVKTLITAGTNGKGTTTLLLSSAIASSGAKVGTYLSPHLQSPAERILHGLTPMSEEALEALVDEFLPTADKFRLTYFEFLTFITFLWAERQALDFLVLEVGLGGRLDATNVTDPIASLITNIDWDHQQWLGDSLEAILNEKFAVVRENSLCFSGLKQRRLVEDLIRRCDAMDTIYYLTKELHCGESTERDWYGQTFSINRQPFRLSNPTAGAVQSALLAYLTLRIVFPKLSIKTLQDAFARVKNPGRFEVVQESPMVILSGDHNPAGVECLESTLSQLPRTGQLKILCAFSPDKPFATLYERLRTISDEITLTVVARLKETLPASYFAVAPVQLDAKAALEKLLLNSHRDDVIIITGSLYLVGELRPLWNKPVQFLSCPTPDLLPDHRSELPRPDAANLARFRQMEARQTSAPVQRDGGP